MSGLNAITPLKAVTLVENAGFPDARRIISDYAAAGLLKSYALVIETSEVNGQRSAVRGCAVSAELWQRIVNEGVTDDVWTGGTVRLKGEGAPDVRITGVSFSEKHLQRLIGHSPAGAAIKELEPPAPPLSEPAADIQRRPPANLGMNAIPVGARTVSVKQTMAALGLGRTKVNELMNEGSLERKKFGARTAITVESIEKLLSSGSD